jgi:hypothetical protein
VPRRDPDTSEIRAAESSAGVKWHGFLGEQQQFGLEFLLAKDYRAEVGGVGASGALGGATWTVEAIGTRLENCSLRSSLLANMQYAWVWAGKNVNGYAEAFYNGLGVGGDGHTLDTLPDPLVNRLARGELFTVSRTYLATGADIEWSPLFTLKPLVIGNLDDGSALLVGQAVYSLSQNTDLTAGFQKGFGPHGSEYGGLETARGSGIYDEPDDKIYARFSWYF